MVTILPALRQVREDLAGLLERKEVERICRELEYTWRERQLDPYTTLHLFILQVVHQNTAMTHLPHLSGERFTASAYCQARQRLPVELIQRLVDSFAKGIEKSSPPSLWHGHRVMLVDGSGFSMSDTPELQEHFGQPSNQKPGCGFPVAHMLAMLDADTGFLHDMILSPLRTHDMKHAADLHPKLSAGDIVVADRGFCSYAHMALDGEKVSGRILLTGEAVGVCSRHGAACADHGGGGGVSSAQPAGDAAADLREGRRLCGLRAGAG